MKPEEEVNHPFELIVGDPGGEIQNGDVPVRWCVTPALVKELEDAKIVDPHILLVTATEGGDEMQRQLVPMTELMTYVRFTRAGTMKLYGFIIDGAKGRKELHKAYLRKSSGDYATHIVYHYDGKPHSDLPYEYTRTEVTIEIPAGVFGKEPGPWMKWFVNLWHSSSGRVVDQCHYRQRLWLAFGLKWIPVTIWAGLLITGRVLVTGSLALAGYFKDVEFLRSFRPFKYSSISFHLTDDLNIKENALFIKRKHTTSWGSKRTTTMFFTLPFNPLVLLIQLLLVVFVITDRYGFFVTFGSITAFLLTIAVFWDSFVWFFQWLERTTIFNAMHEVVDKKLVAFADALRENIGWRNVSIGVGVLILIGLYFLASVIPAFLVSMMVMVLSTLALVGLLFKFQDPIMEWLDNLYTVTPESNDYTEIRELLCPKDEANLRPDIHFIPPKQRTLRLRYLDLKNKVCKPMQQ